MLSFKVVIPARFGSTRLPGKPLLDIGGKPMVIRVVERALESGASDVWVATDHMGVMEAVKERGYNAMMTSESHASGTDRIAEVATALNWSDDEIVVNVQGDEPLMPAQLIRDVAQHLHDHSNAAISTACHPIQDLASLFSPHIVKVVTDREGYAIYFSRAPIPYARDAFTKAQAYPTDLPAYRHIGIYAYRTGFLKIYSGLEPAGIEIFEALEQLRVMWHGYRISVTVTDRAPAAGVDTEEDLIAVRRLFHLED